MGISGVCPGFAEPLGYCRGNNLPCATVRHDSEARRRSCSNSVSRCYPFGVGILELPHDLVPAAISLGETQKQQYSRCRRLVLLGWGTVLYILCQEACSTRKRPAGHRSIHSPRSGRVHPSPAPHRPRCSATTCLRQERYQCERPRGAPKTARRRTPARRTVSQRPAMPQKPPNSEDSRRPKAKYSE